jgi:hypothetical protein
MSPGYLDDAVFDPPGKFGTTRTCPSGHRTMINHT